MDLDEVNLKSRAEIEYDRTEYDPPADTLEDGIADATAEYGLMTWPTDEAARKEFLRDLVISSLAAYEHLRHPAGVKA